MKILLVIDTYDTNNNGTSISAQRFAAVLREHGNEVKILTTGFALDGRSLFLPGSPKDLTRSIDWWLDHPEEKEKMEKEYAEYAKRYNIDESVRQCEEMFREAIAEVSSK